MKADLTNFNPTSYFFNIRLHVHSITFRTEIDSLKGYIIDSVKNIQQLQLKLNEKMERAINSNPNDLAEVYDNFEEQHKQYEDFYPRFFLSSTLISLYSLFEVQLKTICKMIKEHKHYDLSVDDLNGNNYIQKSKKYLELIAKVPVEKYDDIWKEIEKYQQVRNLIVHNNSCIIKKPDIIKKQSFYQFIKQSEFLDLDERDGTFRIKHHDYLIKLIDLIFQYITSIIEELKEYRY